jgi:hypothetical protein
MQKNRRDENIENVKNAGIDFFTSIAPALVNTYISNDSNIANATVAGTATLNLLLKKILGDIANRGLSPREQTKVGATYFYALEKIFNYLNQGLSPRYADLSDSINTRSGIEEILEGVLLKSRSEHEEKKLKILGNIYANTCFLEEINFRDANIAISMATNMTYTKQCILAILHRKYSYPNRYLLSGDFEYILDESQNENNSETLKLLLYEVKNLIDTSIIQQIRTPKPTDGLSASTTFESGVILSRDWYAIVPVELKLTKIGEKFARILSLEDIPDSDLEGLYLLLSEPDQVNI